MILQLFNNSSYEGTSVESVLERLPTAKKVKSCRFGSVVASGLAFEIGLSVKKGEVRPTIDEIIDFYKEDGLKLPEELKNVSFDFKYDIRLLFLL